MSKQNLTVCTRADLDEIGCSTPNCRHDHSNIYLYPLCHPRKGQHVRYEKATGVLTLECVACRTRLARIAVAAGD